MQTPVAVNGWQIKGAEIVVVRDGLKPLVGCDIHDALGKAVNQTLNPIEGSMVNNINTQFPFKIRIANQSPNLISSFGRSKIKISQTLSTKHNKKVDLSIYKKTVNTQI